MRIRRAERKDLDRAYELVCLLEDERLDYKGFEKAYGYALDHDVMYVLEEERILAFLHMRISPQLCRADDICEILELIVDDEYRNRGYGKLLLEQAKEYCGEKGIGIIEVLSSSYREGAHRFYERNGFINTGYRFFNKEWRGKKDE